METTENPKKKVVSIIVPVYNVIGFLEECIDSCLGQDYKEIEVVLVDDGSTDGSGEICDEYAKKNKNIISLHKKNGGLSDARNFGMSYANGQYVMFVDSDDIISTSIVSTLLDLLLSTGTDMSVCMLSHFTNGSEPTYSSGKIVSLMSSNEALCDFMYQKKISTSACAKLFKKNVIKDIQFVKNQRFEDNDFLFRVFTIIETVAFTDAALYGYRHRDNSITSVSFSERDFDIIEIGKRFIEESDNEKTAKAARAYQCANSLRIYLTAIEEYLKDSRYIYCINYLKENARQVLKDSNVRKKMKIGLLFFMLRIPRKLMIMIRKKSGRWK